MGKTFTARTETTYEVVTNYGQTIRVVHEPSEKSATVYFIAANGEEMGEITFGVDYTGVAYALSQMFNKVDDAQGAYDDL